MRELDLLAQLKSALPPAGGRVLRGVGDDAAVVATQGVVITSVDQTVEGVHADMDHFTHRQFGARAVLAAVSDLSAMGVAPGEVLLAVALSSTTTEEEALDLLHGARDAASDCSATLIGGDISMGSQLSASVTVIGHAKSSELVVGRDTAQVGDVVGVTGRLGASGAGLIELRDRMVDDGPLAARHLRPVNRTSAGVALAQCPVSSMIDISDGLATDAAHIGRSSNVSLLIDSAQIPVADGIGRAAAQMNLQTWEFAATAGEDFELLFTVDPSLCAQAEEAVGDTELTWIGEVREGQSGALIDGRADLRGWEHSS